MQAAAAIIYNIVLFFSVAISWTCWHTYCNIFKYNFLKYFIFYQVQGIARTGVKHVYSGGYYLGMGSIAIKICKICHIYFARQQSELFRRGVTFARREKFHGMSCHAHVCMSLPSCMSCHASWTGMSCHACITIVLPVQHRSEILDAHYTVLEYRYVKCTGPGRQMKPTAQGSRQRMPLSIVNVNAHAHQRHSL